MKNRTWKLVFCFALVLSSSGCAYFRWHDPSYEELHNRTEQQRSAEEMNNFNPGEAFQK